jgi:hypothetical protein
MLDRGDSSYRISQILEVSASSVMRFQAMMDAGLFKPIVRNRKRSTRAFMETLELILAAGMPAIGGPRAQRRLQKLRAK